MLPLPSSSEWGFLLVVFWCLQSYQCRLPVSPQCAPLYLQFPVLVFMLFLLHSDPFCFPSFRIYMFLAVGLTCFLPVHFSLELSCFFFWVNLCFICWGLVKDKFWTVSSLAILTFHKHSSFISLAAQLM